MMMEKKTRSGRLAANPPGVTLVELLVVILVSVIVVAVAFTLFRVNVTYYLREDARLEQDQNLRVALATVARDVRMAGNGLAVLGPQGQQFIRAWTPGREDEHGERLTAPGWFIHGDVAPESAASTPDPPDGQGPHYWHGMRAIYGVDGGEDGPDTLTIFRSEVDSASPIGVLGASFSFSSNALQLKDALQAVPLEGDMVALVDGDRAVLAEVGPYTPPPPDPDDIKNVPIILGGRFTPPGEGDFRAVFGSTYAFPLGSAVYNLRDVVLVTYYLEEDDEGNRHLMADYHDLGLDDPDSGAPPGRQVVVASNIEDFQVFYFFDDEPVALGCPDTVPETPCTDVAPVYSIGSGTLDAHDGKKKVRAVALGLVARSPREDKSVRLGPRLRPALFNRRAVTVNDQHTRNILTEVIHLRN